MKMARKFRYSSNMKNLKEHNLTNIDEQIRIVIADDDALVADITERELSKINVVVIGRASDGKQTVKLVKELRPDVALLDMEMPEMTGYQAAKIIMEECPTPMIALTGYSEREIAQQAADSGIGAFLVKPPRAQEIDRAIIIACARFNDIMELKRLNEKLTEAVHNIKMLSGLLPICSCCKKIRDDAGYWHEIEKFIEENLNTELSHGICPGCYEKFYSTEIIKRELGIKDDE
jgi:AmiR/NasT family two-component response regulator